MQNLFSLSKHDPAKRSAMRERRRAVSTTHRIPSASWCNGVRAGAQLSPQVPTGGNVRHRQAPNRPYQCKITRMPRLAARRRRRYRDASSRRGLAPMIDFYALTSPNVQKIYIMLEETGLPYKEHFVDVWKGDQFTPEYLKINPNNKIPAIVDHDGPGGRPYTVFESGAILLYLAEKTGRFLPKETAQRYDAIQWLMIQLTGVGPMFGQFTHFKMFAPKGAGDYALARYQSEVKRLYAVLEQRLSQVPYLGGREYTIADIATFPWTRNHDAQGVKWEDHPNLARWFKAISERPAVKSALAKVGQIKSNRETATDDQKDQFFGRGKYARV
jgi:GST-like protein